MNRKDIINKHARAYALSELEKQGVNNIVWITAPLFSAEDLKDAYLRGAEATDALADSHPAWRKCEDELPNIYNDFIVTDGKNVYKAFHNGNNKWYIADRLDKKRIENVVAWLPIPEFNQKAEEE